MGKGNNMYEEMDRIKQRIRQIEEEYYGTVWIGEGEKIPKSKHPTQEVSQELERLKARLQELKKQDDKAQGIK